MSSSDDKKYWWEDANATFHKKKNSHSSHGQAFAKWCESKGYIYDGDRDLHYFEYIEEMMRSAEFQMKGDKEKPKYEFKGFYSHPPNGEWTGYKRSSMNLAVTDIIEKLNWKPSYDVDHLKYYWNKEEKVLLVVAPCFHREKYSEEWILANFPHVWNSNQPMAIRCRLLLPFLIINAHFPYPTQELNYVD